MKLRTIFFVGVFALFLTVPLFAAPKSEALDEDKDGKIDAWFKYDNEGHLKKTARDTNKDGIPDTFTEMPKGRNLVLRESDRNFDGQIDRRWLTEWDPNKRLMTGMNRNNIPQYTAVPGYVTLWAEEDNDFDGKIDVFHEKGNKNPSKERLGKPILASAQ